MDITLRQMQYIVAVAKEGHFGKAADSCHVSQPALSRQIKKVEELFETQLFERSARGVVVTPAGREFVDAARSVLSEARRLTDRVDSFDGALRGPLSLGIIPTVGPYFLPGILGHLHEAYPQLSPSIVEEQTSRLLEKLADADLDVALMATPVEAPHTETLPLVIDPFVTVVHADHHLAKKEEITAADLTKAQLLLLEEGHCFRDHALEFCATSDDIDEADIRSTSLSTLLGLVELNRGVTILPVLALARELPARPHLIARPFAGSCPNRTLSLLWRATSPRVDAFRRMGDLFAGHTDQLNRTLDSFGFDDLPRLKIHPDRRS